MNLDIRLDDKAVTAGLDFAAKQFPFAIAQSLTRLAQNVQLAETKALPTVFDRPTPFTMRAFGITAARKDSPQAEIFAKARQAHYLEPSEDQGLQVLGNGRKIRTPVDIGLNQYGDIPKGKIASLIPPGKLSTPGPRGFFIGTVKGISGLWQRPDYGNRRAGGRGTKGAHSKTLPFRTTLKLLIAFTRPVEVKSHLGFQDRARALVRRTFETVFHEELRKALETAK